MDNDWLSVPKVILKLSLATGGVEFCMDGAESPLTRVMALHALAYCERLFYLEEVEEIRIADTRVYDGRRFHEQVPEYDNITSLTLESEDLGIYGKVDVVRTTKGQMIPFEYKKGRAHAGENGVLTAWPSDELQVGAYALLLEQHTGQTIPEARVYYASDHRTVVVSTNESLREKITGAVRQAGVLRQSLQRPPIATNERLCAKCSLAPVCLPEEERLLIDPDRTVGIAFPADRDKLDIHVTSPKATVRRAGKSISIDDRATGKSDVPLQDVGTITLHGSAQMTTQTLHLCATSGIPVHWMTGGGRYVGSVVSAAGGVQRRLRQYAGLTDSDTCLRLAVSTAKAKMEMQLKYMMRLSRGKFREDVSGNLDIMREALKKSGRSQSFDALRGWEGLAGRAYFACISYLLHDDEKGITFDGRNRRPPKDPANALLSFLYGLLYRDCVKSIIIVGLDPCIGFFHQARSTAYPLALDLMELFRVSLADTVLIGSAHRNQWVNTDFTRTEQHCWLSEDGRKKAIALYERRKQDVWKHPVIGYSLTYDRAMELEVRLLEKEWSGAPGLFALNRIR